MVVLHPLEFYRRSEWRRKFSPTASTRSKDDAELLRDAATNVV